jgi:hypothetical protein
MRLGIALPVFLMLASGTAVMSDDPPAAKPRADIPKNKIEFGPKRVVEAAAAVESSNELATSSNAAVAPGRVKWHADWNAAMAAAGRSGKPILLFQLLGRMDQRFT